MKKILIAGAGGYVGKNLAEALKGKAEVAGVDVAPGFVRPEDLKSLEGPYDVFYNLAWIGKGGAQRADYNLQIKKVKNALDFYKEAIRLGCKKYICAGTIGELMVELPECAKIRSQNFVYINAKNFLHRVLNSIEEKDKCRVIWAAIFTAAGIPAGILSHTPWKNSRREKRPFLVLRNSPTILSMPMIAQGRWLPWDCLRAWRPTSFILAREMCVR